VNSAARLDSLAEAGADLVATTADVVSRLGQAFGASELPLVTHDGKVRARFFKGNADRIRAWAGDHGVEVSEETSFGEPPR
jgi:hypothetical protein